MNELDFIISESDHAFRGGSVRTSRVRWELTADTGAFVSDSHKRMTRGISILGRTL